VLALVNIVYISQPYCTF